MPGRRNRHRLRPLAAVCALLLCVAGLIVRAGLGADGVTQAVLKDDPIQLTGDYASEGTAESGERVLIVRGRCWLKQGDLVATARQMIVWRSLAGGRESLAVYLEDDVRVEQVGQTDQQTNAFLQISTRTGNVEDRFRSKSVGNAIEQDAMFQRAALRRQTVQRSGLTQTQFVVPQPDQSPPGGGRSILPMPGNRLRHVRLSPRSSMKIDIRTEKSTNTVPPEQITILTGGVNLVVEGDDRFGVIDLSADRIVIWSEATESGQFNFDSTQPLESQFQVYLEGNIVGRQSTNVLHAEQAYYDAREDRGLLLDAELSLRPPEFGGQRVRVRAERLRQLSRNEFHATNAWTTTSQFGHPGYRIQSSDIFVEPYYAQPLDLPLLGGDYDSARFDPETGAPRYREVPYVTSLNNTFVLNETPLFYLPYVAGPADDPNIPLRALTIRSDSVFGIQARSQWDILQILGIEEPPGIKLNLEADYLSKRGPVLGLNGEYIMHDLLGIPGTAIGEGLGVYVHDSGKDNLGADRRMLEPREQNRGRLTWRHQQELPNGFKYFGETGYLSDRNFLEQFYEKEFDTGKDIESVANLQQTGDSWQWGLLLQTQPYEFENNTEWLPRGDLTFLGEPLLGGWLNWSSHTMGGYAQLNQADPPNVAGDKFSPLPYYADLQGGVAMTRHELTAPLQFGWLNVVPYVWGEAAGWSDSVTGGSRDRLVGSAGLRSSIMFTKTMPWVQSSIFNLNGLAHKMVFDVDWSMTQSNRGLDSIKQWNEFDDNAQERFRQRLLQNTYPTFLTLPTQADPRNFAVRSGAGSGVTAPYHELVDDLHVVRLGWRHRLQTKVGPPERLRTKDWMTLDLEASLFPNATRDNFGETAGLLGARYAWHVGDRTSLLAGGARDLFNGGMELWNVGILSQRGTRGSVYVGARQVKGLGFESQILTTTASYSMSEKWISTFGTAFDLAEGRNRGQSMTLTRVGADFLIHFGGNFDASKGNAGFAISVEPRLGNWGNQSTQLGNLLGNR